MARLLFGTPAPALPPRRTSYFWAGYLARPRGAEGFGAWDVFAEVPWDNGGGVGPAHLVTLPLAERINSCRPANDWVRASSVAKRFNSLKYFADFKELELPVCSTRASLQHNYTICVVSR